jgi:aspartate/methionine/tyrosine aminotransferase
VNTRYPMAIIKEKLFARRDEVADFAIGARRLALPEDLNQWIHRSASLAMRPASPADKAAFDRAAASFLRDEYGIDEDAVGIIPTTGGRNAMSAFVACTIGVDDDVMVTEPGYPAFARLASQRGARVHSVTLKPKLDFAPDFSALSEAEARDLKVVFLNYPNNPTGAVFSDGVRNQIFDAVAGTETIIFNDAMYGPLSYESQAHSLLNEDLSRLPGIEVIELHSLTKLYPLGPLAMSFLAGSTRLIGEISNYSEYAWSPPSALQMQATTRCLGDVAGRAQKRDFFARQLHALRKTLLNVGFEPYSTPGGIYVLCKSPTQLAGQPVDSAQEMAERLMDEFDLAVVPWDVDQDKYLRFTALYRPEDLERLAAMVDRLRLDPRQC